MAVGTVTAIASIISALVAGGTAIGQGVAGNRAKREAQEETKKLSELAAQRDERRQRRSEGLQRMQLGLQKRSQDIGVAHAGADRRQREKELRDQKLTYQAEKVMNFANSNEQFKNMIAQRFS